jgi:hypothetical protein
MFGRTTRTLAAAVSLAIVVLVGGANAPAASARTITNEFGTMKTTQVKGETAKGATFVGQYKVRKFVTTRHNHVKAVGKLTGTITKRSGNTKHVSETGVRMPLRLAQSSASAAPAAPGAKSTSVVGCEVLDLVLGPLDLNLLGLNVHLDRVHLNITAVPGAGNLLGNLLCAVAGLLDGTGISGLSGILTNLLNALLGILNA